MTESGLVWVKPSEIHGMGAFARRDLAAGTRILGYLGEAISPEESVKRLKARNACIFRLDESHYLDGNVHWNPAGYFNHSCAPNCEARVEEGGIWVYAMRAIAAGEELTFNYGYDLEDYRKYPCRCGAPTCVGFMVAEEFFEQVRAQRELPPP